MSDVYDQLMNNIDEIENEHIECNNHMNDSEGNHNNTLICPITLKEIRVPAVTSDGYVYESSEIARWLEKNQTSPITTLPISKIVYPLFVSPGVLNSMKKIEEKNSIKDQILQENQKRIKELERKNNNLLGIQTYIKNYNRANESKLNFAKNVSDNNKLLASRIQTYVATIIHYKDDKEIIKSTREYLDEVLKKNGIEQIGTKYTYNFSCLPLRGMTIQGIGEQYNFQSSDLRECQFEGSNHTGGCIHADYTGADMSFSIAVNDFCTKSSTYVCCTMNNAILSGLNLSGSNFEGAVVIGARIKKENAIINLSEENYYRISEEATISDGQYLNILEELKNKIK